MRTTDLEPVPIYKIVNQHSIKSGV